MKTKYSAKIRGTRGNFDRAARFDLTGNYLGITSYPELDRVLLSPAQLAALLAFVTKYKVKTPTKEEA